jgi:hypothetical protein
VTTPWIDPARDYERLADGVVAEANRRRSRRLRRNRSVGVLVGAIAVVGAVVAIDRGDEAATVATEGTDRSALATNGRRLFETRAIAAELPENFDLVDEADAAYEAYVVADGVTRPVPGQWPMYTARFAVGGVEELERDPDASQVIAITLVRGSIYSSEELSLLTRRRPDAKSTTIRGGRRAVELTVSGWNAIEWSEHDRLGYSVTGHNVTMQELREVAASLREVPT